ncbi:MAG TPA: transporter substrate-binding domain-containing protein [Spirochaetota bacterium]|nr:transporter substrate-binding domain-containing protein [Spirochaetota bacterium]HPJ34696.1 transporter substrate-binding domain-containing protein [Spirochaetota bacterium]
MNSSRIKQTAIFLFLIISIIILPHLLSAREKITVLLDDNYPPYIFRDTSGKLQGILVDQWELWSRKTGVQVVLDAKDWGKALAEMKEGKGDVIDTVFFTEERNSFLDYTKPYTTIEVPIFFESRMSGITDIKSLIGYVVGVKEGDACIDELVKNGITTLKKYPSYEAIIIDAAQGNIHIFCTDKPPALYYIYRYKLEDRFRYSISLGSGQFHRAVKKGDSETLELVIKGFSMISGGEYYSIDRKWFGEDIKRRFYGKYILEGFAAALTLALVMVLTALYLRYKVKRRTEELSSTVVKLRESEQKTRSLLSANPDLLFIFDEDGNFLDYKADDSSFLYLPPDEFIGKNVKDVMPEDISELTVEVINSIRKGRQMQSYEYDIDLGDDVMRCESRMVPFGEKKYLAIVRDISEKKKREEEEIRSHKLESLGVFAGGIAHDFNNILTAIVGCVSLARLKIDDREKTLYLLDEAEKAGVRARKLTSQLLAFSKGGAPVMEIASIEQLVIETAEFILSGSKTALAFDIGSGIRSVDIDRGQVEQVMQNIILNASQAMPSGGLLEIGLNNVSIDDNNPHSLLAGEYVAISIKDHGEGIEQKNLKRIFDPYFTTKIEGNGLGLTICHTIIKRHGGAIGVTSQPGEGTVFTIYLPAHSESVPEAKEERTSGDEINLKNLSVLIMDDEPQLRYIMEEVLKDEGADIIQASDGNEAIDIFEKKASSGEPVNIVIADLTIPGGMGGMEAVRILREEGVPFKAIVISGYSSDPVISDFGNYGFDAYLIKPFTAADLLKAVKGVL